MPIGKARLVAYPTDNPANRFAPIFIGRTSAAALIDSISRRQRAICIRPEKFNPECQR